MLLSNTYIYIYIYSLLYIDWYTYIYGRACLHNYRGPKHSESKIWGQGSHKDTLDPKPY